MLRDANEKTGACSPQANARRVASAMRTAVRITPLPDGYDEEDSGFRIRDSGDWKSGLSGWTA